MSVSRVYSMFSMAATSSHTRGSDSRRQQFLLSSGCRPALLCDLDKITLFIIIAFSIGFTTRDYFNILLFRFNISLHRLPETFMSMSMDVTYLGLRASDYFTAPAPSGERLEVFELYSGVASIHKAAVQAGKISATFDNEGDKRQDVLTKEGFQMALHSVLRIVRGGLLTCAPKCGSFVAACQANHNRCAANNFMGGSDLEGIMPVFVQEGNDIATATAFLCLVAGVRGVQGVLENPPSSKLFKFPIVQQVLAFLQFKWWAIVHRCGYSAEPLGSRIGKQYNFLATFEEIDLVAKKCHCLGKGHLECAQSFVQTDTGRANSAMVGRVRWTGKKKEMRLSQAYPRKLGTAIVQAWMAIGLHCEDIPKTVKKTDKKTDMIVKKTDKNKLKTDKKPNIKKRLNATVVQDLNQIALQSSISAASFTLPSEPQPARPTWMDPGPSVGSIASQTCGTPLAKPQHARLSWMDPSAGSDSSVRGSKGAKQLASSAHVSVPNSQDLSKSWMMPSP